jgi:hypothetical protein
MEAVESIPKISIHSDEAIDALCRRIVVAVPFQDSRGVHPELQDMLFRWKASGVETIRFANSGGFLDVVRAHAAHVFVGEHRDRDILVMIDSDVVPEDPASVIELATWEAPVVAAVCVIRNPKGELVANFAHQGPWGNRSPRLGQHDLPSQGLVEAIWIGTGMVAIRREALEKIVDPFLLPDSIRKEAVRTGVLAEAEDQYFSRQAREAGLQLFVDPAVRPEHYKVGPLAWKDADSK